MQSDLRALFIDIVLANETIRALVNRLAELRLPDCYLAAGCLCQTVWNHVSGFPPAHGITDYDIFYCDLSDLSWEGGGPGYPALRGGLRGSRRRCAGP